jgi:hypothetical protein
MRGGYAWPRMPSSRSQCAPDAGVALALCAATVAYLLLLPRDLNITDESYFLYEAKRIRDGEVMYRDIFQFTTPLASYIMAALFWLFGTTVTTARAAMAVLHAGTVAVLYATARRLAVRRELGVVVGLAYLAICVALAPSASWHWFSTFASLLLLLLLVSDAGMERPRRAVWAGLATGALIGIQQQKGMMLAAGVVVLFALQHLVDRRYPAPEPWRTLATRLAYFGVGIALVVVPLLTVFAVLAGPQPLYAALVRFPLENYRGAIRCRWGALAPLGGGQERVTFPLLLRYAPAALLLPLAECVLRAVHRRDRQRVRQLLAMIGVSIFSTLSIWYYPDLVHIAFVAAGFWLCAAVGLEWILSALRPALVARLAGLLAATAAGVPLVAHLAGLVPYYRGVFPFSHDTAFGRVDFTDRWQTVFVDNVRALMADSGSAELFSYGMSAPYLLIGARNPTPYQYLNPLVSPAEHTQKTLQILEQRRVPYIVSISLAMVRKDPITKFINEKYDVVPLPEVNEAGVWVSYVLYRRKDETDAAEAPAS